MLRSATAILTGLYLNNKVSNKGKGIMLNKTNQAKPSRSFETGITLIESMVTFMVIAITLAFALPSVSRSISAYSLRSASDHLAERIAAVRALALAKNKNV